jgi:hypothetical protein
VGCFSRLNCPCGHFGEFQAGVLGRNTRLRSFPNLNTNQFLWVDWPSAKLKAGDTGTRNRGKSPKAGQHPHCRRKEDYRTGKTLSTAISQCLTQILWFVELRRAFALFESGTFWNTPVSYPNWIN